MHYCLVSIVVLSRLLIPTFSFHKYICYGVTRKNIFITSGVINFFTALILSIICTINYAAQSIVFKSYGKNCNIEEMIAYNGWIYYLDNDNLYRMKVDGSKKRKILSEVNKYNYINIADNWIYYCKINSQNILDVNYRPEQQLRKVRIDGSGDIRLCFKIMLIIYHIREAIYGFPYMENLF